MTTTYTNSKAFSAKGTVVSIGPTAGSESPTYTAIAEVKSCSPKGAQYKTADTTNFQSAAEEFIGTMPGTGTATINGNYIANDPGQIALEAASLTGDLYMFQIQFPKNVEIGQTTSGDVWTFNALVYPMNVDVDTEKAVEFSCELKISGAITRTAGS